MPQTYDYCKLASAGIAAKETVLLHHSSLLCNILLACNPDSSRLNVNLYKCENLVHHVNGGANAKNGGSDTTEQGRNSSLGSIYLLKAM